MWNDEGYEASKKASKQPIPWVTKAVPIETVFSFHYFFEWIPDYCLEGQHEGEYNIPNRRV